MGKHANVRVPKKPPLRAMEHVMTSPASEDKTALERKMRTMFDNDETKFFQIYSKLESGYQQEKREAMKTRREIGTGKDEGTQVCLDLIDKLFEEWAGEKAQKGVV